MAHQQIPSSPADITSSWLSTALTATLGGLIITHVEVVPIGTGQTGATYRVAVAYEDAPVGVPATFIVKLPSQDREVRARVALGYRSEHAFYTSVASTVRVPVPRWYYIQIDRDGLDFVMVLDDKQPAEQGNQLVGCGIDEAEIAVRALAGLHGPRWCDPAWRDFTGTVMPLPDPDAASAMQDITRLAVSTTLQRLRGKLRTEDQETLSEATELITDWLLFAPDRFSLLHGDYRLDNLLFHPGHLEVTVVDWQTLAVGLPARDLAFFVATSVQPSLRSDREHQIVATYFQALLSYGVEDYDLQQCWTDYRLGVLQVPLITTLGFAFSNPTDRGDEMALAMLQRGCQAIRELDTLRLIRKLHGSQAH